jgi:hypothetical protein
MLLLQHDLHTIVPSCFNIASCLCHFACLQIAAALDAMIAKKLSIPDSKPESSTVTTPGPHSTLQPASTTAAPSTKSTPAHTSTVAAAANPIDRIDDGTGVQLFRAVPKGTPCVIPRSSRADAWEAPSHDQHQHASAGAGGFGSNSLPRTQPMREQIPRLCLAEASRNGCKRKHDEILTALTVNGKALRAAAAAAGYANRAVPGSGSTSSSASTARKVVNTAGWVKCWRRLKGQKDPGVVVDAKPWVPYEERAAKLLGRQSVSAS